MIRPLNAIAAGIVVLLVGCGTIGRQEIDPSETRQIVQVLVAARTALLHDQPPALCDRLTTHGRSRSLEFQVDFAHEGTPVPSKDPRLPQTCEAIVRREWSLVRRSHGAVTWPADLRHVSFSVISVRRSTARAQLKVDKPYGPVIGFSLRKTRSGWRIDDSDGIPMGY